MAKRFEDVEVWQLARALVREVYLLTGQDKIKKSYSLTDQIQRAALSVMNNIAEGFERQSTKEFIYMLNIAKGSEGEVRSILYVLLDINLVDESGFKALHTKTTIISKSLAGFISYLKNKNP
jgi:four helix bundle protein